MIRQNKYNMLFSLAISALLASLAYWLQQHPVYVFLTFIVPILPSYLVFLNIDESSYVGKRVKLSRTVRYECWKKEVIEATIIKVSFADERVMFRDDDLEYGRASFDDLVSINNENKPENKKTKKKKGKMPRIYKHALWFGLVFIMWRILINFDHIVVYLVNIIERLV